jgi:hypothetical protein
LIYDSRQLAAMAQVDWQAGKGRRCLSEREARYSGALPFEGADLVVQMVSAPER